MIDVAKYEGYGKLHTSIILAAYRDVVSRAKQLEANPRLLSATARYESILSATEINEVSTNSSLAGDWYLIASPMPASPP